MGCTGGACGIETEDFFLDFASGYTYFDYLFLTPVHAVYIIFSLVNWEKNLLQAPWLSSILLDSIFTLHIIGTSKYSHLPEKTTVKSFELLVNKYSK